MADTVPASAGTSALVAVGGAVAGTIDASGDQDWYQVALIAGRQYRFDLQGLDSALGTLSDPVLRLLSGAEVQLALDDDSGNGLESSITYTALVTGTHFLSAQSYGSSGGTFTLGATDITGGPGDVPANTSTTSSVAVGGTVAGTIDIGRDGKKMRQGVCILWQQSC